MHSKVNSVCVRSLSFLACWFISRPGQLWFAITNYLSCPYLPTPEGDHRASQQCICGVQLCLDCHARAACKVIDTVPSIVEGLCASVFNSKPPKGQPFKEEDLLPQVKW